MKNISFIIGSGFSYPRKIPGVSELGRLLVETKADNIFYHSSQVVTKVPLGGCDISRSNDIYTKFYEKFIQFYTEKILPKNENFNYEVFFDYYYPLWKEPSNDEQFNEFLNNFINSENHKQFPGDNDLLLKFHNIYSNLIAGFLHIPEYYHEENRDNYLSLYNKFSRLVNKFIAKGIVNIHSLNHDLLIEDILNKSDTLQGEFSNGFSDLGSKYYGEVLLEDAKRKQRYNIRLQCFCDEYKKSIRLYKLHGSIDTFIFNDNKEVRIKKPADIWQCFVEEEDTDVYKYSQIDEKNSYPEFLTGKASKTRYYKQKYFKELLTHFATNISSCEILLFIGYGFGDAIIDETVSKNFDFKNKFVVIIDIKTESEFRKNTKFEIPKLMYINKSIDNLGGEDIEKIMSLLI